MINLRCRLKLFARHVAPRSDSTCLMSFTRRAQHIPAFRRAFCQFSHLRPRTTGKSVTFVTLVDRCHAARAWQTRKWENWQKWGATGSTPLPDRARPYPTPFGPVRSRRNRPRTTPGQDGPTVPYQGGRRAARPHTTMAGLPHSRARKTGHHVAQPQGRAVSYLAIASRASPTPTWPEAAASTDANLAWLVTSTGVTSE